MQTTNELRRQVSKAGFLLTTILLVSEAAVAQSSENRTEAKGEQQTIRHIVISIPDRKLALIQDGEVKRVFPVAVGKESTPSPSGSFHIVNRVTKPTYYHKGKVIADGPANPVGTRWIGLSEHGYGIHGTNVPSSIGKAASHGCIRMARTDLEQLFELVKAGDAVEIRAERDEETARVFGSATGGSTTGTSTTTTTTTTTTATTRATGTTNNTLLAEAGSERQTSVR